ncbi:hypothetical protein EJ357_33810 [Streptomyces cyaneochromogenes]|uniref:Uncharacterized protein n=1 Tax=Streptomyces cyaneochromogenes TaxID=2496836 RepID=A0A3S9MNM4_9ACTN|nr:hypothetical protein [Streptomyces cyaneochromogenes]AZQ40730.1 hypothetical protein EJ357_33810 [Streptomyces cyaneochromogenes]
MTEMATDEPVNAGYHVGWFVPPFFHELPVDTEDTDEAAQRLFDLVQTFLGHASEYEQMRMYVIYAHILEQLVDAGAVYAGIGAIDMDGRPSTATISVYRTQIPDTTAEDMLSDLSTGLAQAHPDDDIRIVELASGKAVVRIGEAPFVLSPEVSPSGEPIEVSRGQIQAFVPLPNNFELLTFELSTPSMEDWDYYSELFAQTVRSLDWSTDEEVRMAASLAETRPPEAIAPTPEVVQELYRYSSRVLDALSVLGRMDQGNQVSAITCPDCWTKGLRSACTARHHWQVDDVDDALLAAAVDRLGEAFQSQGWLKLSGTPGQSVSLAAHGGSGHQVDATLVVGRRRLVIEVVAPCTRTVSSPGDSVFG